MGTYRCSGAVALLGLCLWAGGAARGSERYGVDWAKVHAEMLEHYTHLLQIDSTNPPGNESRVADYLKAVLDREGIEARLFALDPARANLVARIRGNGTKKPLLVMGHTDTLSVCNGRGGRWTRSPLSARTGLFTAAAHRMTRTTWPPASC